MLSSFWESVELESTSRDDKPRWEVLNLAAERIEAGVMYRRGKGWIRLYSGRVMVV
jgi:hypothetical protein